MCKNIPAQKNVLEVVLEFTDTLYFATWRTRKQAILKHEYNETWSYLRSYVLTKEKSEASSS